MGTPLRSVSTFLSPKILSPISPLSPRLLTVVRKNENVKLQKREIKEAHRVNHVVKRLEFSPSPSKSSFASIQVKITDHSDVENVVIKEDIVINTPNKRDIIRNGLVKSRCFNILGQGTFGKVIRGIHKDQIVAVKVVKNKLPLREKNALHLLHKNIVKTIDIVQNEKEHFSLIIMEYFPNSKQLQTVLESSEGCLGNKIISFAIDICKGLEFCHNSGILHLDLKPQNILVCEGICKICDFGNSVNISELEDYNYQGTVIYSAPELLQGKNPTDKSDIYSLGVVMWQLKFKVAPYHDVDNVEAVVYKVVKCNWRPENEEPVDEYSKIYQNCWNMYPVNRPCASDVLDKLYKIVCYV